MIGCSVKIIKIFSLERVNSSRPVKFRMPTGIDKSPERSYFQLRVQNLKN